MTKILFTDLDGTLLDDQKRIPPANKEAVEEMLKKGHKIVLASGRALSGVTGQAAKLGLDFPGCYLIAFNGGEIYDNYHKKTLYKSRIPIDVVERLFQLCEENNVHVQTYDDHYVLARRMTKHLERYCREIECEAKIVDNIADALEDEPSKVLLLDYDDHDFLEEMRKKILEAEGEYVDSFFSGSGLLEVVLKGTDKGVAVHKLCEILDIPLENSVAAGDGMNDGPMLKAAHIGAAMINAEEPTKKAADYITHANNNEGGVAEIIRKFIL